MGFVLMLLLHNVGDDKVSLQNGCESQVSWLN